MTTNAEEAPFLSAMEREPQPVEAQKPVWREATFSITRNLWSMHAMSHRVLEVLGLVSGKVRTLADRGPDPDFDSRSYERGFTAGRQVIPPNIGGVNGNSKILTALVALNTALLIGVGGWVLATVARHDKELAVIACQLNPQACPQVTRGR
jgi:hypothetical protein